jgi:hypothetical protein
MNEGQLRETIEETLRSEFASALDTDLEKQEETLRAEFEESLPDQLKAYEERMWEIFEDELGDAVEERLQAYFDSVEQPAE